jgi:ferredoxin--NADP+ reductase
VEEIIAVVRRGPAEIKFSRAELENVVNLLDQDDLAAQMKTLTPLMQSLGQNPEDTYAFIRVAQERACQTDSKAKFKLRFLISPTRIIGNDAGQVIGLEVEENTLVLENGEGKAVGLGTHHIIDVDTVVFAIGDRVDDAFGLPVQGSEFVKNAAPRFPVEGVSYEAFDPASKCPLEGIFVAGWSRKASNGLVGVARKDGTNGARSVLQYLHTLAPLDGINLEPFLRRIAQISHPIIHEDDLKRLEAAERERAQQLGLEEYKFDTNQEMLVAAGLLPEVLSASGVSRR